MPNPLNIKEYAAKSVLCWLATVSADGMPNVSPKECFTVYKDDHIIIANIASPQSIKNIKQNNKVCVSFIDILLQKGCQIKGEATIKSKEDEDYAEIKEILNGITNGKFPFSTITCISIDHVKPIIAPSYILYPDDTSEEEQIESAKKAYGL